jgi:hypothetical protein
MGSGLSELVAQGSGDQPRALCSFVRRVECLVDLSGRRRSASRSV